MLHLLWVFAVGVLGWFAAYFFGVPLINILIVRRQIHQELMFSSNIMLLCKEPLFHEHNQRSFEDVQQRIRKLGARLSSLNTSLYQPLPFILRRVGYDFGGAARNLRHLFTELEDDERSLTRYRVEVALRLPHSEESHDGSRETADRQCSRGAISHRVCCGSHVDTVVIGSKSPHQLRIGAGRG